MKKCINCVNFGAFGENCSDGICDATGYNVNVDLICESPKDFKKIDNKPIKKQKSRITSITAQAGVTFELDGVWYKSTYMETRELFDGANEDNEKDLLWESVNSEVNAQMDALLGTKMPNKVNEKNNESPFDRR